MYVLGILLTLASVDEFEDIRGRLLSQWTRNGVRRSIRTKCQLKTEVVWEDHRVMMPPLRWHEDYEGPGRPNALIQDWREEIGIGSGKGMTRSTTWAVLPKNARYAEKKINEHRSNDGVHHWNWDTSRRTVEATASGFPAILSDGYGMIIGMPSDVVWGAKLSEGPFRLTELTAEAGYRMAGREVVAGESCVVLERKGQDRLWLAEEKGLVVARREWAWRPGGGLRLRIINSNFRDLGDGRWVPWYGKIECMGSPQSNPGKLCYRVHCQLESAEAEPADEWFDLSRELPNGIHLPDHVAGEEYHVGHGEDGQLLKLNRNSFSGQRPLVNPNVFWRIIGSGWTWATAAALVLAAALVVRRRQNP